MGATNGEGRLRGPPRPIIIIIIIAHLLHRRPMPLAPSLTTPLSKGIGVTSTGHCHPAVVKAVQEQAATIVHAQQNIFGAHEKAVSDE